MILCRKDSSIRIKVWWIIFVLIIISLMVWFCLKKCVSKEFDWGIERCSRTSKLLEISFLAIRSEHTLPVCWLNFSNQNKLLQPKICLRFFCNGIFFSTVNQILLCRREICWQKGIPKMRMRQDQYQLSSNLLILGRKLGHRQWLGKVVMLMSLVWTRSYFC